MKAMNTAVACFALALASTGAAYAQGAGGGGGTSGGGGNSAGANEAGGANGAGHGGAGVSAPNTATGGTGGSTMPSKRSKMQSPTRQPQNGAHAKGGSDTEASGAQ